MKASSLVLKFEKFCKIKNAKKQLISLELRVWKAFRWLCANFLGNKRSALFKMGVENLLETYKEMGCWMSQKIYFLHSHLDFFQLILAQSALSKVNDFTRTFKQWRHPTKAFAMLAYYCWMLYRDVPTHSHKQKLYLKYFWVCM